MGRKGAANKPVPVADLANWLDATLSSRHFKDYCPNGLQIEGRAPVSRLACAVTASLAVIERAAAQGAQALLVHHGYFWRGEDPCITGLKGERIRRLLAHDISLLAYHLPLDVHPTLGNNAQLAQVLGWPAGQAVGEEGLLRVADLPVALTPAALAQLLRRRLGQAPLLVGDPGRPLRRIGWCTGAAQDMIEQARAAGCDAFLSGEISERTTHVAREGGILYAAAGHHATERYGVQALGQAAAQALGLEAMFLDDPNPV